MKMKTDKLHYLCTYVFCFCLNVKKLIYLCENIEKNYKKDNSVIKKYI